MSARASLVLRLVVVAALLALTITGLGHRPDIERTRRLGGEADHSGAIAEILLAAEPAAAVLRDAGRAPTELELQVLSEVAGRAPLVVELPAPEPAITVSAPVLPLVDRNAAVGFAGVVDPGATITARLLDTRDGVLDSLRVVAGADGRIRGGFRVRPGREGWAEWRVSVSGGALPAGGVIGRAGAWVAPAEPPRVLVAGGPPSWESRYLVRALERSGADVSVVQRLGRDNVLTAGEVAAEWTSAAALAAYDVLVLLPGAGADAAAAGLIRTWVGEGKGLVVAAHDGAAVIPGLPGASSEAGPAREVAAREIVWALSAAIAPLPGADLEVAVVVLDSGRPGATTAAFSGAGEPLLTLMPLGAGRVAVAGILETWRWAMEAGLEAEHRAFWRSLVDWLAEPSADSLGLRLAPAEAGRGATVDLRSRGGAPALARPGAGAAEALSTSAGGGARMTRFVAVDTGRHEIRVGNQAVMAFRAVPPDEAGPAALARARLSLLAAASGGAALEPAAFDRLVAGADPSPGGRVPWRALLFAALAVLAIAAWALRRLRGLA